MLKPAAESESRSPTSLRAKGADFSHDWIGRRSGFRAFLESTSGVAPCQPSVQDFHFPQDSLSR